MELERKKYWLLLFGLIIGVSFDIFFYNKTLGISYIIFIVLVLVVFLASFWGCLKKLNNQALFFVIPILLLSSTFFIFSNQVFRILNYLIVPILVIMLSSLVANINKSDWSDIRFIGAIAKRIFVPFRFIHRPFLTLSRMTDNSSKGSKSRILPKVVIGILISIPLLAIILWLLSSADIVFKNIFINIPLLKIFKHFLIIISVSVYAICFLWALLKAFDERKKSTNGAVSTVSTPSTNSKASANSNANTDDTSSTKMQWKLFLDPVVLLTILILVNAIYAVFSFIQFRYLFGGSSFVLPSSFTYAEYARRGFAELVIVTIINFGILIFGITFVKKDSKRIFTAIRAFLTLLVIFTFILLISAFYRMLVYEQAYGFTYLRIFVQAFMVMLFFLFVINIIYIWYQKLPIIKTYFIISLSIYIIMNFANVDKIIANNNISRYFETGQIDMVYLKGLSYDAVPEMEEFFISVKDSQDSKDEQIANELPDYFMGRQLDLKNQKSWQSYNISRNKAENIIFKYFQE
ncbi:MAG: DUF4173 domain-containing protein [Actinobacteria bacterium]|nr:DUF4173 domain-containing protein [Actinomycetota bacterium]